MFSFGSAPAAAPAAPAPFSFNLPAAPAPAPVFSFGAAAPAPAFSFGAPAPAAAAPAAGFSFGSFGQAPAAAAPAPFSFGSFGAPAPAAGGLPAFGQPAAAPTPASLAAAAAAADPQDSSIADVVKVLNKYAAVDSGSLAELVQLLRSMYKAEPASNKFKVRLAVQRHAPSTRPYQLRHSTAKHVALSNVLSPVGCCL